MWKPQKNHLLPDDKLPKNEKECANQAEVSSKRPFSARWIMLDFRCGGCCCWFWVMFSFEGTKLPRLYADDDNETDRDTLASVLSSKRPQSSHCYSWKWNCPMSLAFSRRHDRPLRCTATTFTEQDDTRSGCKSIPQATHCFVDSDTRGSRHRDLGPRKRTFTDTRPRMLKSMIQPGLRQVQEDRSTYLQAYTVLCWYGGRHYIPHWE